MDLAYFTDTDPQIRNEKNLVHAHARWMEALCQYNIARNGADLLHGALRVAAERFPDQHLEAIRTKYIRKRLERPDWQPMTSRETHHQMVRRLSAYNSYRAVNHLVDGLLNDTKALEREVYRLARLVATEQQLSNELALEAGTHPLVGDLALGTLIHDLTLKHWGTSIGYDDADEAVLRL